jgi:hypothetical protein
METVDINELKTYYEQRQNKYKAYLETELQKFKDANNVYLSVVIAEACEQAKNLFENSNQKAFERFNKSQIDIEERKKSDCPEIILAHIIKSAKKDLDNSLEFNQSLFEQSIAYYNGLLNR